MRTPLCQSRIRAASPATTPALIRRRRRRLRVDGCTSSEECALFRRPSMTLWYAPRAHTRCGPSSMPQESRRSDARRDAGNGKRERGTRSFMWFCPEAAVMSLDDGPADGEANSHAVALGCVEGLEYPIRALELETRADIPH